MNYMSDEKPVNYVHSTIRPELDDFQYAAAYYADELINVSLEDWKYHQPDDNRKLETIHIEQAVWLAETILMKTGTEPVNPAMLLHFDEIVSPGHNFERRGYQMDYTTDLQNRNALQNVIKSTDKAENREYAIFDADRFKIINDTYGHLAGDAILRLIADIMKTEASSFEKIDIYRFGGDEFVAITNINDAKVFTEKVSQAIEQRLSSPKQISYANGRLIPTEFLKHNGFGLTSAVAPTFEAADDKLTENKKKLYATPEFVDKVRSNR
ncbi:MAG: hypothetical protein NVS1B10_02090 [Candidatus Saccharimonadales bacterium]